MLVKLIGSLLIALAGGGFAMAVCIFERKRLEVLDAFIALLFYIKGQIDCYALPISDILLGLDENILRGCMCKKRPESIEEMIRHSKIYLEDESRRLMYSFAAEFGSTFREEQLRRCDYYIQCLCEERRRLSGEVPLRSRTGSALWICSSLGLLIILW